MLSTVMNHIIVDYQVTSEEHALEIIKTHIDRKGLYHVAKDHGVLSNDSAEEFAIEFMTEYNQRVALVY